MKRLPVYEAFTYSEKKLKGALIKKLREELPPDWMVWLIEAGYLDAGKPDLAVLGGGHTSWLEIKFADPEVRDREIQRLTLKRAARAVGRVRYIIYRIEKETGKKETRIVEPKDRDEWMTSGIAVPGFDHRYVARYLLETH